MKSPNRIPPIGVSHPAEPPGSTRPRLGRPTRGTSNPHWGSSTPGSRDPRPLPPPKPTSEKRYVGYVRVSTSEQATEGVSLDAQADKIRVYASLHGLDLVDVLEDDGVSAKTLHRPGLQTALRWLQNGLAEGLIVFKLDRLTRSILDLGALLNRYFSHHQLLSVSDAIDTRSAGGRLVLNVLASVAQWEREAIVERTQEAMTYKRSRNERLGQIPYGKRLDPDDPDNRRLIDDPDEQAVMRRVSEVYHAGHTLREIADDLNREQVPSKQGRGHAWHPATLSRLLYRLHHTLPQRQP